MSVISLTNEALQKLQTEEPNLLLLDVRTPDEYFVLGHIPGACLMPIYELPGRINALNPQQKTVVICEHGIRSADASHYLAHHGFQHIYNLAAGMAEWNGPREFTSEPAID